MTDLGSIEMFIGSASDTIVTFFSSTLLGLSLIFLAILGDEGRFSCLMESGP